MSSSGNSTQSAYGQGQARSKQNLITASQDMNLDPTTQQEFAAMAASNSAGNNTDALIKQAQAGEGAYGIRRKNWELAKLLLDKPGRQQTILSVDAGGGAKGPVASGTLLTTGGNR